MWDGFNKRKFPRLSCQFEVEIQTPERTVSTIRAVTENVGLGGLCAIIEVPIERFSECRVSLDLGDSAKSIRCLGKVVWTIATRDIHTRKTFYDTGIQFSDLNAEDRQVLEAYLKARQIAPSALGKDGA